MIISHFGFQHHRHYALILSSRTTNVLTRRLCIFTDISHMRQKICLKWEWTAHRVRNCNRCLALLSSRQKILSKRVQELESANDDMSARLELLESHGIPESPPKNLDSNSTANATSAGHGIDEKDSDWDRGNRDNSHSGRNQQRPKCVQCTSERCQYSARLRMSEANWDVQEYLWRT